MIDIESAYIRSYLQHVHTRAHNTAEALDWLDGTPTYHQQELAPPFEPNSEAETAWQRFIKQTQTFGPRAYRLKRDGTIGTINWGGDNTEGVDARLTALNLTALATRALKNLMSSGIAAAWAFTRENETTPTIQVLGGHVEPLYADDDAAGNIIGIYQAFASTTPARYNLRIYEFGNDGLGRINEWRDTRTMFEIGRAPSRVADNAPMPKFVIANRTQDGYPIGEVQQALPTFKAEVATQLRIARVSDAHAFPLMWAAGGWDLSNNVSSHKLLLSASADAKVGRVEPGDLTTLFNLHDRILERLRGDLALPITAIGGTIPSGEALEQMNTTYISSCRYLSSLIQTLLTDVVRDYSLLVGVPEGSIPTVSVQVNQERARRQIAEQARQDYRDGLISLRAAVIAVSVYYPHWSDAEIDAFVEDHQRPLDEDGMLPVASGAS